MSQVSCLKDIADPLVLDASVVVNLNATGFASRILHAIPAGIQIPDPVIKELKRGTLMGHSDATDLQALLDRGIVDALKVPEAAYPDYIALVSGSSVGSLGDGEAATIASAFANGAWAALDERKARRICAERYPSVKVASTVDILAHPSVTAALSKKELFAAILAALEVAHMQVQRHQMEWVINRIPSERIENCISLPSSVRKAALSKASRAG